ncbi:MAG: DUF192 domain-containing protein [Burkholderiaceae bacterium]
MTIEPSGNLASAELAHGGRAGRHPAGHHGPIAKRLSLTGAVALLVAWWPLAAAAAPEEAQPPLPEIRLNAGMHVIVAEVADTPASRQMGLMHRPPLGLNRGMLFVFEQSAVHCFWMKNTPTPLSIAFIDQKGLITDIQDMAALSEETHCPPGPVRFALEMSQGWFAGKGIGAGTHLRNATLFEK